MSAALAERYFLEYENFCDATTSAFPARNYVRKHDIISLFAPVSKSTAIYCTN